MQTKGLYTKTYFCLSKKSKKQHLKDVAFNFLYRYYLWVSESAYVYRCKIGLMNVKENKSRIKPNIKSLKVIHKPSEYGRDRGSQNPHY